MFVDCKLISLPLFVIPGILLLAGGCFSSERDRRNESGDVPVALYRFVEEISREKYEQQYGPGPLLENPVLTAARRIARVSVNPLILESEGIKVTDRLLLELFDGKSCVVQVECMSGGGVISLRGSIEGIDTGIFFFSAMDGKVLATIEIAEKNLFYSLIYNNQSKNHYLFESPMDMIRQLED